MKRILATVFMVVLLAAAWANSDVDQKVVRSISSSPKNNIMSIPKGQQLFGEKILINSSTQDRFAGAMAFHLDHSHRTAVILERLSELDPYLTRILKSHGLNPDFKYLFAWESGLDARANSGRALGFVQFVRRTGMRYDLETTSLSDSNGLWDVDERMCPKAFESAANYLVDLQEKFGNPLLVAASYNAGENHIERKLDEQENNSYWELRLNKETGDFIYHILSLKIIYENRSLPFRKRKPIDFEVITVKLKENTSLKKYFEEKNINFGENSRWNRHFREGIIPKRRTERVYVQKPFSEI